jgi:catechol 2,3-dioxygenase-like lactoylglutathione lyase family enzyme
VTPVLVVSSIERAVDFYCGKLGYGKPQVYGDPPCFAMIYRDGMELMLTLTESGAHGKPNGPAGVWDLYIAVTDVAAEQRALEAAGVTIDKGPTDAFYAMREIEVLDPDGHRICFAQDITFERADASEKWEGALDVGAKKLRLVLELASTKDGLVGRLVSLDQGGIQIPIETAARDGVKLRLEIRAIGAVYEGRADDTGARVEGTWVQGGKSWPLELRRVL